MKILMFSLALALISSTLFIACNKDAGTSTLHIRLTDAPAAYDEVNVDLKEVRVNFSDDSTGWITLQTKDTIYNLLGLQNGLDTLVASGTVPANTVKEVRLILGDNNTIKVNGQLYPLTIPSGSTSGLKIKVNKKLNATLETVVLDFDAGASVTDEADGYKLRPVIRVK
jgi:type 1 fimbria pilin